MAETILNLDDLCQLLKMSRAQCYGLCRTRTIARMSKPLPTLRINGNLRWRLSDVERWLDELSKEGAS
jgi:predicted DNA-binding transcriptional regulator AlpA